MTFPCSLGIMIKHSNISTTKYMNIYSKCEMATRKYIRSGHIKVWCQMIRKKALDLQNYLNFRILDKNWGLILFLNAMSKWLYVFFIHKFYFKFSGLHFTLINNKNSNTALLFQNSLHWSRCRGLGFRFSLLTCITEIQS